MEVCGEARPLLPIVETTSVLPHRRKLPSWVPAESRAWPWKHLSQVDYPWGNEGFKQQLVVVCSEMLDTITGAIPCKDTWSSCKSVCSFQAALSLMVSCGGGGCWGLAVL